MQQINMQCLQYRWQCSITFTRKEFTRLYQNDYLFCCVKPTDMKTVLSGSLADVDTLHCKITDTPCGCGHKKEKLIPSNVPYVALKL